MISNGGAMKCLMCKQFEPCPGLTTITLQRDETSLILKNVPALVCPHCGVAYADEATAARLLEIAREMEAAGMQMDIRQFVIG
jgi:YgiT-type zinc finger domain-containing protein